MPNEKTEINDAISLAKAVRNTALQNAKIALTEQFNENYKALFAEKLKKEAMETGAVQTVAGTGRLNRTLGQGPIKEDAIEESDIDGLIKELEADIQGSDASSPDDGAEPSADDGEFGAPEGEDHAAEEPQATATPAPAGKTAPPGTAVVQAPVIVVAPDAGEEGEAGEAGEFGAPEGEEGQEPTGELPPSGGSAPEEDVNLDELLESLKKDIEAEEKEKDEEEECITEDTALKSSGIGGAPGKWNKPSKAASSSSKIETGGVTDNGVPQGKTTSGKDPSTGVKRPNEGPVTKAAMATPKLTKENKTAIKGAFEGGKVLAKDATEVERANEGPVTADSMETANKTIKEQSDAIAYLTNELNEIHLLNTKLLYTNRLFKEHNIDHNQKMGIVEMFDLAKTIREVKMNYATASKFLGNRNPVSTAPKKSNISAAKVQSITEGIDRGLANSGKNQTTKEIISENTFNKVRFQELAGIKLKK